MTRPRVTDGLERYLHTDGSFELELPESWTRTQSRTNSGATELVFRPSSGRASLNLVKLEVRRGVGAVGRLFGKRPAPATRLLLELVGHAMPTRGEPASFVRSDHELAWCDGSWVDDETKEPASGRYWLVLRGDHGVVARLTFPEGSPEPEVLADADRAVRTLTHLDPWRGRDLPRLVQEQLDRVRPGHPGGVGRLDLLAAWCEAHPAFVRPLVVAWARERLALHPVGMPALDRVRHRLRPVIRPDVFYEELPPDADPVRRPLAAKVSSSYVIADAHDAPYVRRGWLDAWGLSVDELHQLAVEGLDRSSDGLDLEVDGKMIRCTEEDGFTAARILSPTFVARLVERIGEPLTLAIPSRDQLYAFPWPPADLEGLKATAVQATLSYPWPITPVVLKASVDDRGNLLLEAS